MIRIFQSARFLQIALIVFITFNSVTAASIICPTEESINPCTCGEIISTKNIVCEGPGITNFDVKRTFHAVREANNASSSEILTIGSFYLFFTDVTEFDFSPFFNFHFDSLDLFGNTKLEKLFVPAGSNGIIGAKVFGLDVSPKMNAVGFGNTFSYFIKNTTKTFSLWNAGFESTWVNLTDGSGDIEFLRGLSSFPNIDHLYWEGNFINKLSGGQFKRMKSLDSIILRQNTLSELGEDALLIPTEKGGRIIMDQNNLRDEKIHTNSGLESLKGGWYVDLQRNQFEYISEEKFGRFLSAHPNNKLVFAESEGPGEMNPFVCDQRMKWLKDAATIDVTIVERAIGIYCSNDPGKTIFTTQLI